MQVVVKVGLSNSVSNSSLIVGRTELPIPASLGTELWGGPCCTGEVWLTCTRIFPGWFSDIYFSDWWVGNIGDLSFTPSLDLLGRDQIHACPAIDTYANQH